MKFIQLLLFFYTFNKKYDRIYDKKGGNNEST